MSLFKCLSRLSPLQGQKGTGSSLLSQPSCWKIQLGFSLDSPLAAWKGGLIKWILGLCGLSFALLLLLVSCGTAGYGKELTLGKPEHKPCLALQGSASSMQIIGSGLWVQRDFPLCRNSKKIQCVSALPGRSSLYSGKRKHWAKQSWAISRSQSFFFWKGRVCVFVEFNHFGEQPPSKHFFFFFAFFVLKTIV